MLNDRYVRKVSIPIFLILCMFKNLHNMKGFFLEKRKEWIGVKDMS